MKKVLIAGGAGYIGSVLVRILLEKGYQVRVIDNLSFGGESLIDVYSHPNFEFIKGDIREENHIENALSNIVYVVHLAAIVGDPACKKFSNEAIDINWTSSVKFFEKCSQLKIKKFVFASTCSNYGKTKKPNEYLNENSELKPLSLYAELKVKFEDYLLHQSNNVDVCTTALRFSTVYGMSPRLRFDLTVNEFTRDVTLGEELVIYGEQFWRPYCHVYDLANSVALILESDENKVRNEVFNVGNTKENYTKKMLVEEIEKVVPDMRVMYEHRNEDPRDYKVKFDKIKNQLGYETSRTVPFGIREINKIIKSGIISNPKDKKFSNI